MAKQFLRKVNLVVSGATDGLDLSQFHIIFETQQSDNETLNTLKARIYNLSDDTARKIQKEFDKVTLQAGYKDGDIAIIFQGSIKQVKRGRESQTETYVEIFAADGDTFYTYGVVNKTIASGWKQSDIPAAVSSSSSQPVKVGDLNFGSQLYGAPRGKVLYGIGRLSLRKMANSTLTYWNIQNGKIVVNPVTGYSPGEAVVLNSATGLIGLPEQTEDGIHATCLLNPKIVVGGQVQIDQNIIQQASIPNDTLLLSADKNRIDDLNVFPPTTADGFYKVLVAEHRGDTRGNDYYTDITCVAIDKTSKPDKSVKPAG